MANLTNRIRSIFGIAPKVPKRAPEVFGFYAIYASIFLYTFSYALPIYLASTFIEKQIGKEFIGLIYAFGAFLSLLLLVSISSILQKFGNRRTALVLVVGSIFTLIGLAFFQNVFFIVAFFILYQALLPVIIFNLDLFLESFSYDASTGSIRGYRLTLLNLSVLIASALAGVLLVGANFSPIFLLSALFLIPVLLLILFSLRTFKDPLYVDVSFLSAFSHLREKPNVRKSLILYFLLQIFYIWITIYLPIYMFLEIGIPFSQILAVIIPIALIPFLLFPVPLGKMADKYHNERKVFILGFFILAMATAALSFITSSNIFIWAGVLLIGRIGVALVETMCGTYFYKHVDASNANLISMFRSIQPIACVIGPILATALLFIPGITYQYLFLVLGIILLAGIPLSMTLERTGGLEEW